MPYLCGFEGYGCNESATNGFKSDFSCSLKRFLDFLMILFNVRVNIKDHLLSIPEELGDLFRAYPRDLITKLGAVVMPEYVSGKPLDRLWS